MGEHYHNRRGVRSQRRQAWYKYSPRHSRARTAKETCHCYWVKAWGHTDHAGVKAGGPSQGLDRVGDLAVKGYLLNRNAIPGSGEANDVDHLPMAMVVIVITRGD